MSYLALLLAGLSSSALLAFIDLPKWVCVLASLVVPSLLILAGVAP